MSSDPVLQLLAAARPGTIRWPAAVRAAGGFEALLKRPIADRRRLGLHVDEARGLSERRRPQLAHWRNWLSEPGRCLITLMDEAYPPQLAALDAAPLALWCRTRKPALLATPQLAIVGSRRGSAGGAALAQEFAYRLAHCGITITSGLAAGIDTAAHRGAVNSPAGTIAVLGCGIDQVYPHQNGALAAQISAGGAVVSEYPPGIPPRAFRFPERNRIIAGLTLGTFVVEAAARSGSLITARLAGDYGRAVLAMPGAVASALSKGCHRLLRQGACLVETVDDIISEIAPGLREALAADPRPQPRPSPGPVSQTEDTVLAYLDFSPVSIDRLAAACGLTTNVVSSMLLHLEFQGMVEALPGGRYRRLAKKAD